MPQQNLSQIGVIGMGVMGANLARNFANHKIKTAVFNRTYEKTAVVIKNFGSEYLSGHETLTDFIDALASPRKIILMVQAGPAVDEVCHNLIPFLSKGDIIIDAGNSDYHDTIRRDAEIKTLGFNFVGMGVSGGEEGALRGPSIMPGGSDESWNVLKPLLEAIAAADFNGGSCVTHIGTDGAGHFVKMVHNGIEYVVMQLLAETYDILRKTFGLKSDEIADIFSDFNLGILKSYLFDISLPVLRRQDELTPDFLVNKILDKAGQKGTGAWTVIDALNRGLPVPSIAEAVMARNVSAVKPLRLKLSRKYPVSAKTEKLTPAAKKQLQSALISAIILSYVQGLFLISQASTENNWKINLAEVCRIWEGGCIIRSEMLRLLSGIFQKNSKIENLLEADEIKKIINENFDGLKIICEKSIEFNVPAACFHASLDFFYSITSAELSANLIQGLRDYFGAHTYERTDREGIFHTKWEE